ncbi:fumarylacetoacetate hydrolase family protein [Sulfitobacter sp. S190]|uniref:fumarylacetoacetate hydrolase family protein n=1 Tax=Sulfitobacter sp. S190 TaxID=2867022 RepID=UPI0021A514E7|nr:fumarylacetoacetate hydrolase family protein [Sulfitobacter sp. S190]UWR22130.1 fumarylacetoacetate hydrolase family protein [Sulfitobacter sp. S190]
MTAMFPADPPTILNTTDNRDFPVARVFCVGRNYAAHAREMGKDPERDPPFYFTKWSETVRNSAPSDALEIAYPPATENFHHEAELVVAIGMPGFCIAQTDALNHVCGYAVGLDMTRRDLQLEAREKGRPWDTGKNVADSCPTGRLQLVEGGAHVSTGQIQLSVNGETRQDADVSDLIWSVPEIIADLSRYYALRRGDLIYTGTPAGVGPVSPGDEISCTIAGLPDLKVRIGARAGNS